MRTLEPGRQGELIDDRGRKTLAPEEGEHMRKLGPGRVGRPRTHKRHPQQRTPGKYGDHSPADLRLAGWFRSLAFR
jgi:hypothetical protein